MMQSLSGFDLRNGLLSVLATAAIGIAAPAAADPIVISGGIVTVDSSDPSYFSFEAEGFSIGAVGGWLTREFGPLRDCGFFTPCLPGTTFDSSAQLTHNPLNSTDYIPGVSLNGVHYPAGVVDGHIFMTGPRGIAPGLQNETPTSVIIQGMLLDAFLTVYPDASRSGMPLLIAQLSGRGWLGVRFMPGLSEGSVHISDLTYRFGNEPAPVPEPGTLLLITAGAACLLKRRTGDFVFVKRTSSRFGLTIRDPFRR